MKVRLEFWPATNQPTFGRLSLVVNQQRVDTVKKLKEKVAKKLSYFPQCIFLFFNGVTMEDDTPISQFKFEEGNRVFIIVGLRESKPPKNVEPLIVGGIDVTDIPEFRGLLTEKSVEYIKKAPLPSSVLGSGGQRQEKEKEVDLRAKYKNQIEQMMQMGMQWEEGKILTALESSNGNVQLAVNRCFGD